MSPRRPQACWSRSTKHNAKSAIIIMECNRDAAEQAADATDDALAAEDYGRAERLARKSATLWPCESAAALVKRVERAAQQAAAVHRVLLAADPYSLLQVTRAATDSDIRKAFHRHCLMIHPDKAQVRRSAEAFSAVNEAQATLLDPVRRALADKKLVGRDRCESAGAASRTHVPRPHRQPEESTVPASDALRQELGLPEGWRVQVKVRGDGKTWGQTDKYYLSPCGRKFRSKREVKAFVSGEAWVPREACKRSAAREGELPAAKVHRTENRTSAQQQPATQAAAGSAPIDGSQPVVVQVPPGIFGGMELCVQSPVNRTYFRVTVPDGLRPGSTFQVVLS